MPARPQKDRLQDRFCWQSDRARKILALVESRKGLQARSVVSSEYAGTQAVNRYLMKVLDGRPADVYDVKFRNQEMTFYIARDSTDGKIHYIHTRPGPPNDEKMYLFAYGPG